MERMGGMSQAHPYKSFSASEIDRWMELPHRSAIPQEQA